MNSHFRSQVRLSGDGKLTRNRANSNFHPQSAIVILAPICSRLQALFVTVLQTSVDFVCKNSCKNSFLIGYFDCFLLNHTVGCCNISFSCLSPIRRENFCFPSNVSNFFLYFFARLQLSRCHVWPTFHPATP